MSGGGDHRRSSSSAQASSSPTKSFSIFKAIVEVPKTVISALSIEEHEEVVTSCRQCRDLIPRYGDNFCSELCALHYWERLRQENGKASGKWLCSMPGCDKHCYREKDGRVHDYCSKTHAEEYKKMKGSWFQVLMPWKSVSHDVSKTTSSGSSNPTPTANTVGAHSVRHDTSGSGPIYFYDKYAPFYEFTNFYYAQIVLDQKTWKTTEHYFQAQKFVGTPYLDVIQACSSPREAFDFSRKPFVSCWCRKDWDGVKIDIMRKALMAKFTQHDNLRRMLTSTGKRKLVERSPYDSFWGDGGDGSGQNWLGQLLMEIRNAIS